MRYDLKVENHMLRITKMEDTKSMKKYLKSLCAGLTISTALVLVGNQVTYAEETNTTTQASPATPAAPTQSTQTPKTADTTNLSGYVAALLAAFVGFSLTAVNRYKSNQIF